MRLVTDPDIMEELEKPTPPSTALFPSTLKPVTDPDILSQLEESGTIIPEVLPPEEESKYVPGEAPIGVGEAALSTATGMLTLPVSGIAGLFTLYKGPQKAAETVRKVQEKLTYQPRTVSGQQVMKAISYPFEKLGEVAEERGEESEIARLGEKIGGETGKAVGATIESTGIQMLPMMIGRVPKKAPQPKASILPSVARTPEEPIPQAVTKPQPVPFRVTSPKPIEELGRFPLSEEARARLQEVKTKITEQPKGTVAPEGLKPVTDPALILKLEGRAEIKTIKPRVPSLPDPTKDSLAAYIRKSGGINYQLEKMKGELDRLTPKEAGKAGLGIVNRQGQGLTLDRMLERLKEEGYFGEQASINDLLNTLEAEVYRGQKVFSFQRQFTDKEFEQMAHARIRTSRGAYADTGGYISENPSLIEQPEIVEIAHDLLGGKYPAIHEKLRAMQGRALGVFWPGKGRMAIKADIFKEPGLAEKVISHEVGHVVDWLPEMDPRMARGNILGSIATLKKYAKGMLDSLPQNISQLITQAERSAMRTKATKEIMGDKWHWTKGRPTAGQAEQIKAAYQRLVDQAVSSRGLITKNEVMAELKRLTQIWKPFDEQANPNYAKYRYSPRELYADAVSVLFNDPSLLKQKAPKFYQAFFAYLDRKPEVKAVYEDIQNRITSGRKVILDTRQRRIEEMIARGEEKFKAMLEEERWTWSGVLESLKLELVDTNAALIRRVKELKKSGVRLAPQDNPMYWVEELPYVSGQVKQMLREINNTIKRPANRNGITDADLGELMFLQRVATERASFANPLGMTKQAALEQLEFLKKQWGSHKFSEAERYVNQYRQIRKDHVFPFLEESRMLSPELMTLIKDSETYATFNVQKYMEAKYGRALTAKIYEQIGTLQEITNPFIATILKDSAMIRAANRKIAAEKTVKMLTDYFPGQIRKADTRWNGRYQEPLEPRDPKLGMIMLQDQGKIKAYYVDRYIAESFGRDPYEAGLIVRVIQSVTAPIKDILVSKNPFFTLWNIQRDIRSVAKQLPGASLPKALKFTAKAIPEAYQDVFKNISTQDVAEMYRNRELIVGRYFGPRELAARTELDRLLLSFAENNLEYSTKVIGPFTRFWAWLDKPGQFSERLTKIAGHKFLKETRPDMSLKEIAHLVRTRAGSPDFRRAGHLVQLYNNIILYSNAGKEGWRASLEAFRESPSAYTWKTVKYDIIPKLAMYGASIGLLGPALKEMFDNIPENDKAHYMTVPIGMTEQNKTVYIVIPHDFTGELAASLLWKTLNVRKAGDIAAINDYLVGGIPYSGLNPILQAANDVILYSTGKNPYDSWNGKPVIPDREFEAGGWYSGEVMLKHLANQLGSASLIYRFRTNDIGGVKDEIEKLIDQPVIGRGIVRFVRVSNRGKQEQIRREALQPVRQRRAIESLEVEDAIVEHLQSPVVAGQEDAMRLYERLIQEGKIKTTDPNAFADRYFKMMVFRNNMPYARAFLQARTNEEKAAILNHLLKAQENKNRSYPRYLPQGAR